MKEWRELPSIPSQSTFKWIGGNLEKTLVKPDSADWNLTTCQWWLRGPWLLTTMVLFFRLKQFQSAFPIEPYMKKLPRIQLIIDVFCYHYNYERLMFRTLYVILLVNYQKKTHEHFLCVGQDKRESITFWNSFYWTITTILVSSTAKQLTYYRGRAVVIIFFANLDKFWIMYTPNSIESTRCVALNYSFLIKDSSRRTLNFLSSMLQVQLCQWQPARYGGAFF